MNTLLLSSSKKDIKKAAEIIRSGGIVAMPTETVYGLASNALDSSCVDKIYSAKGRPSDNPLIVHISDIKDIEKFELVKEFPKKARDLASRFWPGPLTIIFKKTDKVPDKVSGGLDTVAIRYPQHKTAQMLIKESGCPLAAPSANSSGKPSPTSAAHVLADLNGKIDAVIDGGVCDCGVESTVITLAEDVPRILRPGIITKEQIEAVIGRTQIDSAVLYKPQDGKKVSSPGMKYKHYSPNTKIVLVRANDEKFINFINRSYGSNPKIAALCYNEDIDKIKCKCISLGSKDDLKEQASRLFDALRKTDTLGADMVYAHCPRTQGIGITLYNRLIRAAAYQVIDLPDVKIIGLTGQSGSGKSEVARILRDFVVDKSDFDNSCRDEKFKRDKNFEPFVGDKGGIIAIIDADEVAREAVKDKDVLKNLCSQFGDILNTDGTLNRKKLAEIAFSCEENKKKLNQITHPKILSMMLEKARTLEKKQAKEELLEQENTDRSLKCDEEKSLQCGALQCGALQCGALQCGALQSVAGTAVVFDAPQLFEAKCDLYCDVIISVISDDDLRLKRIKARDNITQEEVISRFKAQYSKEFFIKNSDYVIENNSSLEKLREKTLELFGKVI